MDLRTRSAWIVRMSSTSQGPRENPEQLIILMPTYRFLPILSHLVKNRCLRLFSHVACSSPRQDYHRVAIRQVAPDWKRPVGRPSHTLLRAIEADLGPLNFGLATAWRKATTRDEWRHIVDKGTPQWSTL